MKRLGPADVAGVVIASLIFVVMIGLVEIVETELPGTTDPPPSAAVDPVAADTIVDIQEPADCEREESQLAARLDRSRSCKDDSDCTLARFGCPFECIASISTSMLDDLQLAERTFQQRCHRCVSSCPATLLKWRATCVRQRCIMVDRSLDELEQETLRLINESS